MPKKTRTPEQKLAREIQAATGRKYMDCLREAKTHLAKEQGAK
jgi:hypothetical protein